MTETKELRIPFQELTLVAFRCKTKECQAELTFDLTKEKLPEELICPFCSSPFDSVLLASLKKLKDWRLFAANSGHEITLRIPVKCA